MALQTKDPSTAAISSVGTAGSGGTTSSTKPVIIGTADAGNIVVIYDGIKPLGSVVAGADGKWTFTPTADLKGGAHNFAAIAHDTAGNFGASSAVVSVTIASAAIAQPTAPTLTNDAGLPIVAGSTTNDAHPHINGNGTAGDIIKVLDNGTVIGSTTIGSDGKWSFTPSPNLPSGDHAITVIETNPAGTTSSPASNPIHITIDTSTPATPSTPTMTDEGGATIVPGGTTNDPHPHINGNGTAGDTITVYDGGKEIGSTTVKPDGSWSFTPSPDLTPGNHDITVIETNPAGTPSTPSDPIHIVIDTSVPAAPAVPVLTDAGGTVIPAGSTTAEVHPHISGKGTAGDIITVYDGATVIGSVKIGSDGNWTFTPATNLSNAGHSITVTDTNAAGTTGPHSGAAGFTVDTTVPAAPVITTMRDYSADGDFVAQVPTGSTIAYQFVAVLGTTTANAVVYIYDGATLLGSKQANASGAWNYYKEDFSTGTHDLSATVKSAAGVESAHSSHWTFTVDTGTPAKPAAPTMTDEGGATIVPGGTTNDPHPHINGNGTAGDTITVYDGGKEIGSTTVKPDGSWSFTPSPDLTPGNHDITVIETNPAGTPSTPSDPIHIVIDTSVPAAPAVPVLTDAGGTVIPAGSTTAEVHPHISGKGTAGDIITVYDGATVIGSVKIGSDGNWTFTPATNLSNAGHSITVTDTNAAGTTGPHSGAISFTVDSVAPAAPAITAVRDFDSGGTMIDAVSTGSTIAYQSVSLTGTATANAVVYVYDGANVLGSSQANASGVWSYFKTDYSTGAHDLSATVKSAGSVESAHSNHWTFTVISVSIPATPAVPVLTDEGGSVIPAGSTTADAHPHIGGNGTAGDIIKVYDNGSIIGSTTIGSDGKWTYTPSSDMSTGAHSITVTESNSAGTSGQSGSIGFNFAGGSTIPDIPVITSVTAATGSLAGNVPSGSTSTDAQPTLKGTGHAGDTITVYDGLKVLGTTTVGSDGIWSFKPSSALSGQTTHSLTATESNSAGMSAHTAPYSIYVDPSYAGGQCVIMSVYDQQGHLIPSGGFMTGDMIVNIFVSKANTTPKLAFWGYGLETSANKGYFSADGHIFTINLKGSDSYIDGTGYHDISSLSNLSIQASMSGFLSGTYVVNDTDWSVVTTPLAPGVTGLVAATGVFAGNVPSGGTSSDAQPTLKGTGHRGDTITVFDGGSVLGTTTVGADGTWSFKTGTLSNSTHTLSATETNSAGTSAHTAPYLVSIDGAAYSGAQVVVTGVYDQQGNYVASGGVTKGPLTVTVWVYDTASTTPPALIINGAGGYPAMPTHVGNIWTFTLLPSTVYEMGTGKTALSEVTNLTLQAKFQDSHGTNYSTSSGYAVTDTNWNSVSATRNVSATQDVSDADQVVVATDHSTVDANGVHHTSVETDGTFHGTAANGNETVDLNVDPTAYFKQATAHIEGSKGAAIDTLHLTGDHQVLDLTSLTGQTAAAKVSGIEVVDLGGAHNTLKLSLVDVLNLGEADLFQQDGKQQMMVKGAEGDVVDLSNSHIAGLAEGEWQAHGTTEVGGVTYNVYEHSGVHTELLVQQGVQIVVH